MRRLLLACLLSACASTSLEEGHAARALEVAGSVDSDRLVGMVTELVAAHADDTPLDCSVLDLEELDQVRRPVCHLTRDKARVLVREQLEALGYTVTLQSDDDGVFSTSNVVAERKGTTRPDEVVLVGAHFDAFHAAADDNSSGVAAMLEIARALAGRQTARTVRFVGFDLEEFGLVGSTRYVQSGGADGLVAAVVFDCIGFASPTQQGLLGFPMPPVGDFLGVIANAQSEQLAREISQLASRQGGVKTEVALAPGTGAGPMTGDLMRSDHAPFWLAEAPALFLTDTANFRNPHYHTADDHLDTLDPAFLARVTKLSTAAIAYWAQVQP